MTSLQPPILNLYGEPPRPLHRPTLAAIACWCLVLRCLLTFPTSISFGILVISHPRHPNIPLMQILAIFGFAEDLAYLAGFLLLAIADLARGSISPWPRRLMAIFASLATFILLLQASFPYFLAYYMERFSPSFEFVITTIFLTSLVSRGFMTLANIATLVYILQLARRYSSKPLAIATRVVIIPTLLLSAVFILMTAWDLATRLFKFPALPLMPIVGQAISIFGLLLTVATIAYLTILALRLHRIARLQNSTKSFAPS